MVASSAPLSDGAENALAPDAPETFRSSGEDGSLVKIVPAATVETASMHAPALRSSPTSLGVEREGKQSEPLPDDSSSSVDVRSASTKASAVPSPVAESGLRDASTSSIDVTAQAIERARLRSKAKSAAAGTASEVDADKVADAAPPALAALATANLGPTDGTCGPFKAAEAAELIEAVESKIAVDVCALSGGTVACTVAPGTAVRAFVASLTEELGRGCGAGPGQGRLRLSLAGRALSEERTLSECGVASGAKLQLLPPKIRIFIEAPGGKVSLRIVACVQHKLWPFSTISITCVARA